MRHRELDVSGKIRGDVVRDLVMMSCVCKNLAHTKNSGGGIGRRGADMISHVKSAFSNRSHGTSLRGINHFANR